jgi:hypothetical protein
MLNYERPVRLLSRARILIGPRGTVRSGVTGLKLSIKPCIVAFARQKPDGHTLVV